MKKLFQGAITTGSGTLCYTVPTGFRCNVQDIVIANTTAASINVRVHLVPTGVAVGTTNAMFYDVALPANTTVQWSGTQTLNAGDFIQGIGSASGVTLNISGEETRVGM